MRYALPLAALIVGIGIIGCTGSGDNGMGGATGGTGSMEPVTKYEVPVPGATARTYDATNHIQYLADPTDGNIWVYNNKTKTTTKIAMPTTRGANLPHPFAMAADYPNHRIFVIDKGLDVFDVVNTQTNTVSNKVDFPVGEQPLAVRYDATALQLYTIVNISGIYKLSIWAAPLSNQLALVNEVLLPGASNPGNRPASIALNPTVGALYMHLNNDTYLYEYVLATHIMKSAILNANIIDGLIDPSTNDFYVVTSHLGDTTGLHDRLSVFRGGDIGMAPATFDYGAGSFARSVTMFTGNGNTYFATIIYYQPTGQNGVLLLNPSTLNQVGFPDFPTPFISDRYSNFYCWDDYDDWDLDDLPLLYLLAYGQTSVKTQVIDSRAILALQKRLER